MAQIFVLRGWIVLWIVWPAKLNGALLPLRVEFAPTMNFTSEIIEWIFVVVVTSTPS